MKKKSFQTSTALGAAAFLLAGSISLMGCGSQSAEVSAQQITSSQELMAAGANSTALKVAGQENPTEPVPAAGESIPLAESAAVFAKTSDASPVSEKPAEYIGEKKAKQIALTHAGISETDVAGIRVKQDYDDGSMKYKVEFYTADKEYDYDIDAVSGAILGFDYHIGNKKHLNSAAPSTDAASSAGISAEEAKKLALAQVPGATDSHIRLESDHDHGKLIYEGKIVYNGVEYEFEIDAEDGTILEWEEEH